MLLQDGGGTTGDHPAMQLLSASYNFLTNRSPDNLIRGGLALLVLSLVIGGIHALARRKRPDNPAANLIAILATAVVSAVLAVGYAASTPGAMRDYTFDNPPPGGFGPGLALGPQILRLADADKDGLLTPKEAAEAAERFVREADTDKKGSVDWGALSGAINRQRTPPPGRPPALPYGFLASRIVELLDGDKDGHVTPDEAARFVREAAPAARGYIDSGDVVAASRGRKGAERAVPPQP